MADSRRWFDSSQPQTLQGAVMLCYITAFFGVLGLLLGAYLDLVPVLLGVGGFGVANERRWGYVLATVLSLLNVLVGLVALFTTGASVILLNLLFAVVLAALLLHPQSREYQRIWFK